MSKQQQGIDEFTSALARVNNALDVLTGLQTALADPPQDAVGDLSPAQLRERTAAIGKVFSRLGYDSAHPRPAVNVAERLPNRLMGDFAKEGLRERLRGLLASLEGALAACVQGMTSAEAFAAGFCKVSDFGSDGIQILTLSPHSGPMQIAAGRFRSLPPDHPLLGKIQEPYRLEGHSWNQLEIIALGPPLPVLAGQAIPRPIYSVAEVTRLTAKLVAEQEQEKWSIADQQRRERKEQAREWWQSELGKRVRQEEQLSELAGSELPGWITKMREKGQIPDYEPNAPTVR